MTGMLPPLWDHVPVTQEQIALSLHRAWNIAAEQRERERKELSKESLAEFDAIVLELRRGIPGMHWPCPKNGPVAQRAEIFSAHFRRVASNPELRKNRPELDRHLARLHACMLGEGVVDLSKTIKKENKKPVVLYTKTSREYKGHLRGTDVWSCGRDETEAQANLNDQLRRMDPPLSLLDCDVRYNY